MQLQAFFLIRGISMAECAKMHRMDSATLASLITARIEQLGVTNALASRRATGKNDAVSRILAGHKPSWDRACQILEALGLEVRVEAVSKPVFRGGETPHHPGGDEALEALVARIRAHWDALGNAYARRTWALTVERSVPKY